MGYQDYFLAPLPGSIALFFESLGIYICDAKTTIYPSTTRGGKELPSSSALDSPSVLSKLATPKPASAINSDMSHVIDDVTSAMHDTYDETTSMLDTTVPLGEFLDEQLARARENEIIETDNIEDSDDEDSPPNKYELPVVPEGYVMDEEAARAILACNDRYDLKRLLAKWKQQSLNAGMKPDPAFAINSDMLHVIDDATSTMHDTYD